MHNPISRFIVCPLLALAVAGFAAGCASDKQASAKKEVRVSLADLSALALATVEKVTAGGKVDQIDKEVEKGKAVYDVEATVGGKHVEFLIADADGAVLGTETSIEFSQLPEAVRMAAEK